MDSPRTPPINGVWVVSPAHELTPEIVDNVKEGLEQAAAEGKHVIVLEGIKFRWSPTEVVPPVDVLLNRDEQLQAKVREYAVALAIATRGDNSTALREAESWLARLPSIGITTAPINEERFIEALKAAGYTLWDNDAGYVISPSDVAEVAAEYLRLQSTDPSLSPDQEDADAD